MTLRFSKDFWGSRRSMARRPAREDISTVFQRYLSESLPSSHDNESQSDEPVHVAPRPESVPLDGDCNLYLPEGYEPNYPYPLIVWFHRAGSDEQELLDVMPRITTQNCLGLSLRGPVKLDSSAGYDWPAWDSPLAEIEELLHSTVRSLRREYHIHSERIFPAGFAEGGALALRMLFSRPEWFGGAAALNFRVPSGQRKVFTRFRDLTGKRLLLGTGCRDRVAPAAGMLHLAHLLQVTGLEIETRVFDAGHDLPPAALRRVDHWLMEGICAANRVA